MAQTYNSEEPPGVCQGMNEAEIDESLQESFPSSDPPAWTLGVDPHCEPQKKGSEAGRVKEDKNKRGA